MGNQCSRSCRNTKQDLVPRQPLLEMNGLTLVVLRYNLVFVVLALVGASMPTRADWPKPIDPPKSGTLTPIGPPSGSTPAVPSGTVPIPRTLPATVGITGKTPLALAPVDMAHQHIPRLIDQMLDGKLTHQSAWDEKLLSVDDLIWIFTSYIDPWGSFRWKFDVEVRRGLAKLLGNANDKLQAPEKLPPAVRLWLADYYQSIGNEKCVTLSESILSEIKMPVKGENTLVFQTIERLGRYYAVKGQPEKAAQTWLRMQHYHADIGRWTADSILEAACQWRAAGKDEEADKLFARVQDFGNGWFTGLALWEQANTFIDKGRHNLARQLLIKPVSGEGAEQIRVANLSLLGYSYLCTHELDLARRYGQDAITQYQSLKTPYKNHGLEQQVEIAKTVVRTADHWMATPLVCEPQEILLVCKPNKSQNKPITTRVTVKMRQEVPLTARCDDPQIKISFTPGGKKGDDRDFPFFGREMVIEIPLALGNQTHENIITVQSPAHPKYVTQMRLVVIAEKPPDVH